jgi:AraC-like DNA-binding protein
VGPDRPGADHIEDYRTLRIIDLIRRYVGAAWRPAWIGLMHKGPVDQRFADSSGAPRITTGERFSVVAIDRSVFSHGGAGSPAPDSRSTPGSAPESDGDWGWWIRILEAALPTEAALGSPSAEVAAEMLGWSVRTLQRRLREEGTSYRRLLLETRHREARRLLLATDDPVYVIAHRVGYTDPANFARAFRGHWGLSPQSLRDLEQPSLQDREPRL